MEQLINQWAEELSKAIVSELFGEEHGPRMIRELDRTESVCREYLAQFFDKSEFSSIARTGMMLGYNDCKRDVLAHVSGLEFKPRKIVIGDNKDNVD